MIVAIKKGKMAKASSLKKALYGKRETKQNPFVAFSSGGKKAAMLLEQWVKDRIILPNVNFFFPWKIRKMRVTTCHRR